MIKDVEDRINPLSLMSLVNVVIGQIEDPAAALLFVEPLENKVKTDNAASIRSVFPGRCLQNVFLARCIWSRPLTLPLGAMLVLTLRHFTNSWELTRSFALCDSLRTTMAGLKTRLGEYEEALKVLEECSTQLDELQGVTPVHANYYKVTAELHKIEARFAEFYGAALK